MAVTRVFCMIPAILFAVIIAGGVMLWGKLSNLAELVGGLDLQEVVSTLDGLEEAVSSVDWEMVSDKVEQLDVEALNKTIGDINGEELNKAIENLNDAAEALDKASSLFK